MKICWQHACATDCMCSPFVVRQAGGGFIGWVIRIIFDPNTRQQGRGGGFKGGDPWITFGSFLNHFGPFCLLHFQLCANGPVDLWIIFWKLNCWNK